MRFFLKFILLLGLIIFASSIILPDRYQMTFPRNPGPVLDRQERKDHRTHIEQQQPQIVLLGDSTLIFGLDTEEFSKLTGKSVYSMGYGGSSSAFWYLLLKNNIAEASYKPEYVFVVFRNSILTVPGFRVQGYYLKRLDEYARANEPLFIQNSFVNLMSPMQVMAEKYFPLYVFRTHIRNRVDDYIRYSLPAQVGCDALCVDGVLFELEEDRYLDVDKIEGDVNAAESILYTDEQMDFASQVNDSYLPEMIRIANENDIKIIFARIPAGTATSVDKMESYMTSLSGFIQEHDAYLMDFGTDPRFTEEHYQDSLHLNEKGKALFTELLAEEFQNIFPQK